MKSSDIGHASGAGPASHRFPNFADRGGIICTEADAADRGRFQPLFHGTTARSTHAESDKRGADGENQMEQARQRGYQTGFDAGRQDACQMANHLLAPHVDRFRKNLECLVSYQQNIADHASTHILKLAVAIAERIMGTDAYVTMADLQELRPVLIEAIGNRYEMHLRYHPQDLSRLQQVLACDGETRLQMVGGLNIAEDIDVSQGTMIKSPKTAHNPSIEDQVQPFLLKLLRKAE